MLILSKNVYQKSLETVFWIGICRQSGTVSSNFDQKSLETEFWIAICRPIGDKWRSKTLFLVILCPRSSIAKRVLIATYQMCCQSCLLSSAPRLQPIYREQSDHCIYCLLP